MSRARFKTPKGQRSGDPMKDEKAQKSPSPGEFASPFRTTDPARFLYETFAESQGWRDPRTPSGKMKKWEELSIHDRKAWAAVNEHMIGASGHISMKLPAEDGSQLAILRRRGNVYAVEEVALSALVRIADVRKALAALEEELQRYEAEYADAELRRWNINEPNKFEAPA